MPLWFHPPPFPVDLGAPVYPAPLLYHPPPYLVDTRPCHTYCTCQLPADPPVFMGWKETNTGAPVPAPEQQGQQIPVKKHVRWPSSSKPKGNGDSRWGYETGPAIRGGFDGAGQRVVSTSNQSFNINISSCQTCPHKGSTQPLHRFCSRGDSETLCWDKKTIDRIRAEVEQEMAVAGKYMGNRPRVTQSQDTQGGVSGRKDKKDIVAQQVEAQERQTEIENQERVRQQIRDEIRNQLDLEHFEMIKRLKDRELDIERRMNEVRLKEKEWIESYGEGIMKYGCDEFPPPQREPAAAGATNKHVIQDGCMPVVEGMLRDPLVLPVSTDEPNPSYRTETRQPPPVTVLGGVGIPLNTAWRKDLPRVTPTTRVHNGWELAVRDGESHQLCPYPEMAEKQNRQGLHPLFSRTSGVQENISLPKTYYHEGTIPVSATSPRPNYKPPPVSLAGETLHTGYANTSSNTVEGYINNLPYPTSFLSPNDGMIGPADSLYLPAYLSEYPHVLTAGEPPMAGKQQPALTEYQQDASRPSYLGDTFEKTIPTHGFAPWGYGYTMRNRPPAPTVYTLSTSSNSDSTMEAIDTSYEEGAAASTQHADGGAMPASERYLGPDIRFVEEGGSGYLHLGHLGQAGPIDLNRPKVHHPQPVPAATLPPPILLTPVNSPAISEASETIITLPPSKRGHRLLVTISRGSSHTPSNSNTDTSRGSGNESTISQLRENLESIAAKHVPVEKKVRWAVSLGSHRSESSETESDGSGYGYHRYQSDQRREHEGREMAVVEPALRRSIGPK